MSKLHWRVVADTDHVTSTGEARSVVLTTIFGSDLPTGNYMITASLDGNYVDFDANMFTNCYFQSQGETNIFYGGGANEASLWNALYMKVNAWIYVSPSMKPVDLVCKIRTSVRGLGGMIWAERMSESSSF